MSAIKIPYKRTDLTFATGTTSFTCGGSGTGTQSFSVSISITTDFAYLKSIVGGSTYQEYQSINNISSSFSNNKLTISGSIYKYVDNSYNNRQYTVTYAYLT